MPRQAGRLWPLVLLSAALVVGTATPASRAAGEGSVWRGAETLNAVQLAPNPLRCGPPPRFLEGRFAGDGVDTIGGVFAVTASGCLDTEELRIFDLEATDAFLRPVGTLTILPADFDLQLNEQTCMAATRHPVPFTTGESTGALAGATGQGTFHFAMSYPPCGGVPRPAHVWFTGTMRR